MPETMSKVETALDMGHGSTPRLPVISDSRSLVSPTCSTRPPSYRELASSWAQDVRQRITVKIHDQSDVDDDDIITLRESVKFIFITALQKNDRHSWMILRECIQLVEPLSHLLSGHPDIIHYLERIYQHLTVHRENWFELQILESLDIVFSKDLTRIRSQGSRPLKNYCPTTPAPSTGGPTKRPTQKPLLPNGKDPYRLERPEDIEEAKPKRLTFGDLKKSLPNVALEVATREAIWSACVGTTARAMNIDLPEYPEEDEDEDLCQSSIESLPPEEPEQPKEPVEPVEPLSGRAAVEHFSTCYHTGQIEFMYFNFAPNRRYNPYDLVETTKLKANPEHLVFSTFGVLHVFSNQPSENMSLSAWQREAVLFTTITKLPFFKHYLMKRMFKRWHSNVHFKDFAKTRSQIAKNLLQNVPSFGAALLHVSKLCQELLNLTFLPTDTIKCYKLGEFENAVNYMNIQAEKILERFFRYSTVIVDTTAEESLKKLKNCEEQSQHKTVFSKDSMSLQKAKKLQRARNLAMAREEASRLGNFVKLVDRMLLSHLVKLARHTITQFVYQSMAMGSAAHRDGLFMCSLVFDDHDKLTMSPRRDQFPIVLYGIFEEIPRLICQAVLPLDGTVHQMSKNMESRSSNQPEEPPKSSRLASIAPLMRDPKKQRPEVLRKNMAATAAAMGADLSPGGTSDIIMDDGLSENLSHEQGSVVHTPDVQRRATPSKSQDDMGVATPDLVLTSRHQQQLAVSGQGFVGQYTPITRGNLADKLHNDEAYSTAIRRHEELMNEALEELDEFCKNCAWLSEIHAFCRSWTDKSVQEWKGVPAFNIEQKLNELRQWGDKVRNFEKTYITDNALFVMDCSGIHDYMIPCLNRIFQELCQFMADQATHLGMEFNDEMADIVKNIKHKSTDIGEFAVYAKNVSHYKKNTTVYMQRMEYVKSLFEVIRMSYRHVTPAEERLEESMLAHWEAFLSLMQDAMEFVNTQTPLITQTLEESFMKLEEKARRLCKEATSGKCLDATQKPSDILQHLRNLRDAFYDVQKQIEQGSKWREAITGETSDLSFLYQMSSRMTNRNQLWCYVDVTEQAIQEWKQTLFSKMNARKIMDKLMEWQATARQLKSHLPEDDAVLAHWFKMLTNFKQELPLLHKLSNDALKPRHWRLIFLGLGEQYNPDSQLTVEGLLSYNLRTHADIISQVYQGAVAEYAIEQRLNNISKFWADRNYKLAKHIPDSLYIKDENRARSARSAVRKLKRIEKYRLEKNKEEPPTGLKIKHDNLFVLIDLDELRHLLHDCRVQVDTMLTSPFVADNFGFVSKWSNILAQADEITELWINAQTKWLYLLKVFDDVDFFLKMPELGAKFEAVHNKLMELVQAVSNDPKVISIVNHQRGERGYRLCQGDRARDMLQWAVNQQELILKELTSELDVARNHFPRLYFLSDEEMVELLAISRNPRALQTHAVKCFFGIDSLSYSLPNSKVAVNSSLDVELNVHKLEVTHVHGILGEDIPLHARVEAHTSAISWLAAMEKRLKTTLQMMLEACVQSRLEDGSRQPIYLLEELQKHEPITPRSEVEDIAMDIKHTFSHWLLHFPAQCVLTAEAILWERAVYKALEKQDINELKEIRFGLVSRIEQYVKVIQEHSLMISLPDDMRMRLQLLLGALVTQAVAHRDQTDTLLSHQRLSDGAFDWLSVLKYHMDIFTVLRAKTDVSQTETNMQSSPENSLSEGEMEDASTLEIKRKSQDDAPLRRGKTTVCTGYQFGSCYVSQMGAIFSYDHEYFGPTSRLVLTPLTNRAILNLTMALKNFQPASLLGPPGTGKTDTVKELAKGLGRHLVSVTCSSDLTLPIMTRYVHGMVQSGSWVLFDDTDRLTKGLFSVFAQQLKNISTALHVLSVSHGNQYGLRGQPRFDKSMNLKGADKRIRRNSLTTLHSLPADQDALALTRQATVPHGFRENGLSTYFEDPWVRERERRHSIEKEIKIKESELYKSMRPPPLFYEHVTLHKKPKADFTGLDARGYPYKPKYLGNIFFSGKLIHANVNYGCFMTMNSTNPASCNIPDNVKMNMRPCAMIIPDTKVIIRTILLCHGYSKHEILATKLALFLDLLKKQLPSRPQYNFSLRTVACILKLSADKFFKLQQDLNDVKKQAVPDDEADIKPNPSELMQGEEASLILAINLILGPKMAAPEDTARFRTLLRDVFPQSARPKSGSQSYSPHLVRALQLQLQQDGLQHNPDYLNKILSLYAALTLPQKQAVMLVGCTGSGKTTIYRTLCRAMNNLHNQDVDARFDPKLHEDKILREKLEYQPNFLKISEPVHMTKQHHSKWDKIRTTKNFVNKLWESLSREEHFECPKVDLKVVYPNSMDCQQLFGGFVDDIWQPGLFSVLLSNSDDQSNAAKSFMTSYDAKKFKGAIHNPKEISKWLVLDGEVHPEWVDHMNSLLDTEQKLSLANEQKIKLPDTTSLIFEMSDLTNASPSMISRCVLVHCGSDVVPWKFLIQSWCAQAKARWLINTSSLQVLNILISSVFPATLTFLEECASSLLGNVSPSTRLKHQVAPGIQEVTSFLHFMTALMDEIFLRDEWERKVQSVNTETDDPESARGDSSDNGHKSGNQSSILRIEQYIPNYMTIIKSLFAFSYVWGFGGNLHDRYRQKFSDFARDALRKAAQPIHLPEGAFVYDLYIDTKLGSFLKWSDKQIERSRNYTSHFAVTPEIECYNSLVTLMIRNRIPVLVVGDPGVGKSSMVNNMIQAQHQFSRIVMSPVLTSSRLQNSMVMKIRDRQTQLSDPIYGYNKLSRSIHYIEDLNTAYANPVTGAQVPLEVLRQLLSERIIYDPQRRVPVSFADVDIFATSTSPGLPGSGLGSSSHVMSSRLTRLFVTLTFARPDEAMLHNIYTKTVHSWLEEFPTRTVLHPIEFAKALVQASIDMYNHVRGKLHASPVNPQYVFSLYDVAHHLEGLLLMSPRSKTKLRVRAKKYTEQKHKQGDLARPVSTTSEMGGLLPEQMRSIVRLWCHESTRVYGDRLIGDDDQQWFESLLEDTVIHNMCTGTSEAQTDTDTVTEDRPSDQMTLPFRREPTPVADISWGTLQADELSMHDEDPKSVSVEPLNIDRQITPIDAKSVSIEADGQGSEIGVKKGPNSSRPSTAKSDMSTKGKESSLAPETEPVEVGVEATASNANEDSEESEESSEESNSSEESASDDSDTDTNSTDAASKAIATPPPHRTSHKKDVDSHVSTQTPNTKFRKSGKAGTRRGVTFKAGLITDRIQEAYTGPLMSMDQIKEPDERLTDFIFCKHIVPMHAEAYGMQAERGYTEYVEEHLSEALQTCLLLYNKASGFRLDLIFFREAVEHVARLSRVLAMPNGHSLLLSVGYSNGRATLVRLAAFFAHCKLFEPKLQAERANQDEVVHDHIKQCGKVAGIQGKQVVLFIREELGDKSIADVCAYLKEGTYPGLYTQEELQAIAQQMTPGQVKITRLDKIESAFKNFLKRVQQNLHVVFSFNYTEKGASITSEREPLYRKLQKFSILTTVCCHIDVYHPWTYEAYMTVAQFWLKDPNSKIYVPWNEPNRSEQMYLVAMAMTYIHQSAKSALEKLYSHQKMTYKFFTPLTFTEFIHIFKAVASYIFKRERTEILKHESALSKVHEAHESIASYRREVSNLFPSHQKAMDKVRNHVECVEVQRGQYKQALDVCKDEEMKIERMLSPLQAMRAEAQIEFNKVNPTYHAALSALKSLNKAALEEIKTYRIPPSMVNFVLEAVCLLFKQPQNWETAKGMLIRDSFFHDLEFFDKDNIPDDIYEKLGEFYHHKDFTVDTVRGTSTAVAHLCWWVRSVYEYATICRTMQPRIKMLQEAEDQLNKAQTKLGAQRVEANRIKSALESRIQAHSEAIKNAKAIEKEIQMIERKITKANRIMENMQLQHSKWRTHLRAAKSKIRTSPGDALITAAIICYHGPLDNKTRAELMHDWLNRCEMTNFDPSMRLGRHIKQVSLSAKMENFMRPQTYSITDSVHSIQQVELYQAEVASHRGDDASSIHETERASSASSVPQMSLYRHHPSVYDTSIGYKTEIRIVDNAEPVLSGYPDLESVDASSMSSRNLLAVREGYTLQDVLSDYDELSDWKLKGLPSDIHSIHNALIIKVCCYNRKSCWPLLIDPDNQAELWVRHILQGSPPVMVDIEQSGNTDGPIEKPLVGHFDFDRTAPSSTRSRFTTDNVQMTADVSMVTSSSRPSSESRSIRTESRGFDTETRSVVTRQSGLSDSSGINDGHAVTSIYTSVSSFMSLLNQEIQRPEDNLWIIRADDSDVNARIINAVVHGVALLITHMECKQLDPLFRGLLLKQYTVNAQGQRVVCVGDVQLQYHPDFALYLSSSVPLFLKGEGVCELPVHKMCPIDLSLSQELIIDRILSEVLRTDRPEFDASRRSMDREYVNHQRELNAQHELIMKKTLDLQCAILDDETMLDALKACQKQIYIHETALEESLYMRENLEEKRQHLITVATHGAKIYEIVQRVAVLNPMYHMPLSRFMDIVRRTVVQQHRGKGFPGDPKARAQELINAITMSVYNYVSLMLFESHLRLFVLLITLERLRMSQQLTNQELGLFVNGFVSSELEDNIMFDDKPAWLSNKVWLDCAGLETTVDAFHQLRQTLTKHSQQWQEYFKCPAVLLNDVPGTELVDLTVFQKCLLWRICAPNKMADVCKDLVIHELGGLVSPIQNYSVQVAYEQSNMATPIIFILPSAMCQDTKVKDSSQGHVFASPQQEVLQFARSCSMEGRLRHVTCGVQSQMSEVEHALLECMTEGYWLIIQNAHLAKHWPASLLQLIYTVVSGKPMEMIEPLDHSKRSRSPETMATDDNESVVMETEPAEDTGPVHKDFRLWVTARADEGHLIPGILIQHGLKITCEQTGNIKDTLKRTYVAADSLIPNKDHLHGLMGKIFGELDPIIQLSLLYTLLITRQSYVNTTFIQNCNWSQTDLASILDQLQTLVAMTQRSRGLVEITEMVFAGHCTDQVDADFVRSLVKSVMVAPEHANQINPESPGITGMLHHLLGLNDLDTTFEERVDALVDIDGTMMSLPLVAEQELANKQSRNLLDDLVRVIGAPELISTPLELSNKKAEAILQELVSSLESFPDVPQTNPDAFYPLELFLHQEAQLTKHLIGRLKADAQHSLHVAQGKYSSTFDQERSLVLISQNRIPCHWFKEIYPTSTSLSTWIASLRRKCQRLAEYVQTTAIGPLTYDLGVFHRPDRFLHAILLNHVRKAFKDLHTFSLDIEILPVDAVISEPPTNGVYISGLTLHNAAWCPSRSILKESSRRSDKSPKMPVIWLKPMDVTELEKKRHISGLELYNCPVYCDSGSACLSWNNVIGTLPLPTTAPARLWTERKAFLACGTAL